MDAADRGIMSNYNKHLTKELKLRALFAEVRSRKSLIILNPELFQIT